MVNLLDDLMNLNEKFSHLFCTNETNSTLKLMIKLHHNNMSGLCYWCESRALIHCKNCKRNFCKFCVKGGHLNDESKCVCFICGCYELTDVINDNNGYLKDREMYDMLHRYEGLFSNDKLANSIHDLLINIDAIDNEKLPRLFDVIKMNIYSMLHDVQKIESMVNRATNEHRTNDIKTVLMPLMKVVMKHHVFKRLGRPQHCIVNEEPMNINIDDDYVDNLMEQQQQHSRMEISRNSSTEHHHNNDYLNERVQRSPECLADEDRLTSNFEINETTKEDDDNNICDKRSVIGGSASRSVGGGDLSSVQSLSLISSQINQLNKIQLQFDMKNNSPSLSSSHSEMFSIPSKENQLAKRKRSKKRISSDIERRSVRLRSESSNNNVIIPPINALHSDLSRATTLFKSVDEEQPDNSSPVKRVQRKSIEMRISPKKLNWEELSTKSSPRGGEKIEIKEESSCEFQLEINNRLSASMSDGHCHSELKKFVPITNRNKNSHLVSPAPIQYERPFVLKEISSDKSLDCIDEDLVKQPVSHKTWSWERTSLSGPKFIIPTNRKSIISEDISKILTKSVIIPKPILDTTLVVPVRGRPRLSTDESVKRVISPSLANNTDSDEPKKKRGRPRKYFDFVCHTGETSNGSHEDLRNLSDVSDSK